MTTVAERIAEIKAAAAARGHNVKPQKRNRRKPAAAAELFSAEPLPRSVAPLSESAGINPPGETESRQAAALRRPLPGTGKPVETRTAARLICVALGSDWYRADNNEHRNGCRIVNQTGLTLYIHAAGYPAKNRYSIGMSGTHGNDKPASITVSRTRSPQAIAGDVRRRLLNQSAQDVHTATLSRQQTARRKHVNERLTVLRIARAAGQRTIKGTRSYMPPHTNESTHEISLSTGTATGRVDYCGRVQLDFEDISPEMAELLIKTAKNA